MDSRSYDILNVEEVEELMKVRVPYQFFALMHPNLFHHKSTRYYHHASGRFKENLQQKPKSATLHRTSPGCPPHYPHPVTLHAHVASINFRAPDIRAQSRRPADRARSLPRTRRERHLATHSNTA